MAERGSWTGRGGERRRRIVTTASPRRIASSCGPSGEPASVSSGTAHPYVGRLAGLILLLAAAGAFGQESAAPFEQRPGWLLQAQGVLRVDLVQGRITVAALETLPATQAAAKTRDGREEILRLQATGGVVSLGYQLLDDDKEITYDVQHSTDVRIRQRPRREGGGVTVDFRQPSRGPVQLDVDDGPRRRSYRGASLWHLLLTDPGPTRRHLAPLVELLRPSLRLASLSDEVRGTLFASVGRTDLPSQDEVVRLVRSLDDSSFVRRQQADRSLRALGAGVGPHLSAIDPSSLSLEQRERVKSILDGLAGPSVDTPERVAAWLATDPLVWVELLRDEALARRQTAATHLVRLVGAPVTFDPQAEGTERDRQVTTLRRRFESGRP